ncbi:MAG: hypothetical protein KGS72_21940 [Cyanobacteria bacterium REEB67]|nr:hypothetical protein [Cyanobacteria bacterium REEB67]
MTNQPKLHQSDPKTSSLTSLVQELNQLVGGDAAHSYLSLPDATLAAIAKKHNRRAPFSRREITNFHSDLLDADTTGDASSNSKLISKTARKE